MPARPLLVIGSSGHARVVAQAARLAGWQILGYVDDFRSAGTVIDEAPVLGTIADASRWLSEQPSWAYAIGIGDNHARWRIAQSLAGDPTRAATIIHPRATIADDAQIEHGVVVLAAAVVGCAVRLGRQVLVNTGAQVDHDSVLGAAASLAPGAITGGQVEIGEGTAVGLGVLIRHRVRIGAHCVIGQGANVLKDVPERVVAYGNPARVIRSRAIDEPYL